MVVEPLVLDGAALELERELVLPPVVGAAEELLDIDWEEADDEEADEEEELWVSVTRAKARREAREKKCKRQSLPTSATMREREKGSSVLGEPKARRRIILLPLLSSSSAQRDSPSRCHSTSG